MTKPRARGLSKRAWTLIENWGGAALVSLVVSAGVTGYINYRYAAQMERAKEEVATLVRYKDQVDSSQSNIIAQLGVYTDRLFRDRESAKIEDLQKAIITAQLQLNRMRDRMSPEDQPIIAEYENELGSLLKGLRAVSTPNDLGPVLVSAQKILAIHDKFSDRLRNNIKAIF